LRASLAHL
jgi:hypothetical protein